jgi:hypothetical protein
MASVRRLAPLLLLVAALGAPRARAGDDDPFASPIRAVMLDGDAGLLRIYDGVRKGLEQAALPRVGLDRVADSADAFRAYAKHVEETKPPLLFLIGRRAVDRAIEADVGGPRVFVDTALVAGEKTFPGAPSPKGPCAVVRGLVSAHRWAEVVRAMYPGRTTYPVRLPFSDAAAVDATVQATGLALAPDVVSTRPGPLLLSDDLARWGRGAAVVLTVDHHLLGRVAAEAGRRLVAGEQGVLLSSVGATELRIDLDAADAAGLHLPLPFVAAADLVRAKPRRSP